MKNKDDTLKNLEINMKNKLDLDNCGNEDALSFGRAMLKIEKLKETVNRVLPEYELGETLNKLLREQNLNIDIPLTLAKNVFHLRTGLVKV